MQVPDRFQQVPTPEMWIPYKASSIFIQVLHRFQKVPTGSTPGRNLDPCIPCLGPWGLGFSNSLEAPYRITVFGRNTGYGTH